MQDSNDTPGAALRRARLERLAALLAAVEAVEPGGTGPHLRHEPQRGALVVAGGDRPPVIGQLMLLADDDGWILTDFDWPAWASSEEATTLRDDTGAIEQATEEQLAKLLTTVVRQDRFTDDSLERVVASGLLARILRRAGDLAVE